MDHFDNHVSGLESPASRLADVTPDDVTDLSFATRAINVEAAGYVQVETVTGDSGRVYVAAGVPFPIRATKILATGTTATGIVALA